MSERGIHAHPEEVCVKFDSVSEWVCVVSQTRPYHIFSQEFAQGADVLVVGFEQVFCRKWDFIV